MRKACFAATVLVAMSAMVGCSTLRFVAPTHGQPAVTSRKIPDPVLQKCGDGHGPCEFVVKADFIDGICVLSLPEEIHVYGRGDRTMTWTLQPQSPRIFRFDRIRGEGPRKAEWDREFVRPVVTGRTVLTLTNRRSVFNQSFDYAMEISSRDPEGGRYKDCGIDPVIVNKG